MMDGASVTAAMALLGGSMAKGLLLLGVAGMTALAMKGGSAAGRHLVWLCGAGGLLLLPLAGLAAPRWSAPVTAPAWTARTPAPGGAAVVEVVAQAAPRPAPPAPSAAGRLLPRPQGDRARAAGSSRTRSAAPSALPAAPRASAPRPEEPVAPEAIPSALAAAADRLLGAAPSLPTAASGLLGLWAVGALLLLSSLAASLLAVGRLARRCRPFPAGRATEMAARVAADLGVGRPVRVLLGDPGAMPMSWGLRSPVILLPEGAERWHAARLEAVLLHEMAHVRRRDCLTQVVAEVARALHWPNPLAWLAVERLRVEREHACDDLVLARGTRPSEYARELLSLARGFHVEPGSALAAVAMARPAHLRGRLRAVLEEGRPRSLSRRRAAATFACAMALTLAVAGMAPAAEAGESAVRPIAASVDGAGGVVASTSAPSLQSASCGTAAEGWQSSGSHSDNGRRRITWERPGCEVEVRVEGEIAFTPDFRDVVRLGPDARLLLEEDDDGTERVLDVRAGDGGAPVYAFRVEGREQPFDAGARAWYQGLLLQLFRRSGFMAEERLASLLREGGVAAVLQELGALDSDHVFAAYVAELLEQASLSEAEVVDLIARARSRVDSDHYMSEILQAVAARHLGSDRVLSAFIEASGTIESDHYRSGVLTRALERGDLPPASVEAVLASAASIDSDHYLAELLEDIGERYALEPRLRAAYLRGVESIESDHYRAEVLGTLMRRRDLDAGELADVLRATRGLGSDHYKSEVLKGVASMALDSEALRSAYLDAAASIASDHYRAEALGELVGREGLSQNVLVGVLEASRGIGSAHYRAELLLEIVALHPLEGRARDAFLDVMDGIDSSHSRAQVADALLRRERGGG